VQQLLLHHHFKIGLRPTNSVTVEPFRGGEVEVVINDWNYTYFVAYIFVVLIFTTLARSAVDATATQESSLGVLILARVG
jgi:hypothetical protein